jgi:hypothetical protein
MKLVESTNCIEDGLGVDKNIIKRPEQDGLVWNFGALKTLDVF